MGDKITYAVFSYHINYPKLGLVHDEFVPYKQALELKELGYDIPTMGSYTDENSNKIKEAYSNEYELTQEQFYYANIKWITSLIGYKQSKIIKILVK